MRLGNACDLLHLPVPPETDQAKFAPQLRRYNVVGEQFARHKQHACSAGILL